MTGAPTVLVELLAECEAHGIWLALASDGAIDIDAPEDALTPGMLARLKAYKADLLALLQSGSDDTDIDLADARSVWCAALDRLAGDPLFPPDLRQALQAADVRWIDEPTTDNYPQAASTMPMPESQRPRQCRLDMPPYPWFKNAVK